MQTKARVLLLTRPKTTVPPKWWPTTGTTRGAWVTLDDDGGWMSGEHRAFVMDEKHVARVIKQWESDHHGKWDFKTVKVKT